MLPRQGTPSPVIILSLTNLLSQNTRLFSLRLVPVIAIKELMLLIVIFAALFVSICVFACCISIVAIKKPSPSIAAVSVGLVDTQSPTQSSIYIGCSQLHGV